jgi:hypothetical protein
VKTFRCSCPARAVLFFESTHCTVCGRLVGFCPDEIAVQAFDADAEPGLWVGACAPERRYRQCANYSEHAVCNWMVPADDDQPWCRACRCNEVIPDLSLPKNVFYWRRLEAAKRYALYTLLRLDLPFASKPESPDGQAGLLFRFMSDKDANSEFTQPLDGYGPIYTGHQQGAITINLAEADDVARTRARVNLGEGYRTLLGHFRHELGHYYWNVLVEPQPRLLKEFRALFGDERSDYEGALQRYYAEGAVGPWQESYLSAYASMHPWEDWAECWAHYMHMTDTLETAQAFELRLEGGPLGQVPADGRPGRKTADGRIAAQGDALLNDWIRLAIAMNALNRSMGMEDAYPFVLTAPIRDKLQWIHRLIARRPRAAAMARRDAV